MSKHYVVVTYEQDYADEFDVCGLWITTVKKYNKALKHLDMHNEEDTEYYFGTNECIHISPAEFFRAHNLNYISKKAYKAFKKVLGKQFGTLDIVNLVDILSNTLAEEKLEEDAE